MAQKHPCVVLHVGHLEGTPHSLQSETLRELQEALLRLSVERAQVPSKRTRGSGAQRGRAAKPCAFLVQKQLQRFMIRCACVCSHVCVCVHVCVYIYVN